MGPYCKFCGDRCFIPTTKDDIITRDLKATCPEGVKFDLDMERLNELEQLRESEITEVLQKELNELANNLDILRRVLK